MPITKSAKKALRQSLRREKRNKKRKNEIKKEIKEIKKLLRENKKEEAAGLISKAYKVLDKAAKTGAIKKNTAGRKKSKIAKLIKASK